MASDEHGQDWRMTNEQLANATGVALAILTRMVDPGDRVRPDVPLEEQDPDLLDQAAAEAIRTAMADEQLRNEHILRGMMRVAGEALLLLSERADGGLSPQQWLEEIALNLAADDPNVQG